jgi:hypothetical protein
MNASITQWPLESICFARETLSNLPGLGTAIYQRVCRTNFESLGFCAVNLRSDVDSIECRRLMVALKQELTKIQRERTGHTLQYLSAARFDQQESTKPHLGYAASSNSTGEVNRGRSGVRRIESTAGNRWARRVF